MSSYDSEAEADSMYNSLRSEITRRLNIIAKGTRPLPAPYSYGTIHRDPSVVIYRTINQVFQEHQGDIRDVDGDEEDMKERMHAEDFVYSPMIAQTKKSRRNRIRRAKSSKGSRTSGKRSRCPNGSRRKSGVCVPKKKKRSHKKKPRKP